MKKLTTSLGIVLMFFLNNSSQTQAQGIAGPGQCETGGPANIYCPYWDVTYEVTGGLTCETKKN